MNFKSKNLYIATHTTRSKKNIYGWMLHCVDIRVWDWIGSQGKGKYRAPISANRNIDKTRSRGAQIQIEHKY